MGLEQERKIDFDEIKGIAKQNSQLCNNSDVQGLLSREITKGNFKKAAYVLQLFDRPKKCNNSEFNSSSIVKGYGQQNKDGQYAFFLLHIFSKLENKADFSLSYKAMMAIPDFYEAVTKRPVRFHHSSEKC